jgi:predicted ribosome quality control (RQC) complex YloA/Tae2 family protein
MFASMQNPSPQKEGYTVTPTGGFYEAKPETPATKPAEPTSKSDVVERYKEINDLLADSSASMDKASAAADRLWGPSRVNAMKAVNDALENNIELLKQKQTEAKGYLLDDTENLQNVLTKEGTGIQASFDASGNISNYDAIMTGLYNELHDAETSAGDEWDENEQKKIEAIQDRIDKVKEAIGQYDETKELVESIGTEIQDSIYQWQDNNYEILNLELSY